MRKELVSKYVCGLNMNWSYCTEKKIQIDFTEKCGNHLCDLCTYMVECIHINPFIC